jgi:ribosome-binding ATPase YchF (GTP1/OBG family)
MVKARGRIPERELRGLTSKPVLYLCHTIAMNRRECLPPQSQLQEMARNAMQEHDRALVRIAQLERELKIARRAILYPMTDLA